MPQTELHVILQRAVNQLISHLRGKGVNSKILKMPGSFFTKL